MERQRTPGLSPRRDDPHEYRVGRLKHERVKVPRGEQLLDWAIQVMKVHSDRKSILEVEFAGEEGTGTVIHAFIIINIFHKSFYLLHF